MFDHILLGGTPDRSIALETRRGTPIPNAQALAPDAQCRDKDARLHRNHPAWQRRTDARGVYNCFGLLFAARRTAIYESDAARLVLREDGYRQLQEDECPRIGDIVIYVQGGSGKILHGAIIVDASMIGRTPSARVLSKMDDVCGEYFHNVGDVPGSFAHCATEYWTDRQ